MRETPAWLQRILGREPAKARAPDDSCLYAVGDVHGRLDLLIALVGQIARHSQGGPSHKSLVFLGDYIDRGPDSKRVIDFLIGLSDTLPDWELIFIRGNHDQAMLDFIKDPLFYRIWRDFGGQETLLSYGVMPPRFDDEVDFARAAEEFARALPPSHFNFVSELRYSWVKGDFIFVHAGVRPGLALERQAAEDLMWIREEFLSSNRAFGKVVVHGHTPTDRPVQRHNRIGVDTGAHATDRLTAAVLIEDRCTFLDTGGTARKSSRSGMDDINTISHAGD